MKTYHYIVAILFVSIFAGGCKKSSSGGGEVVQPPVVVPPITPPKPDDTPPIDNTSPTLTIEWSATATKLSHNVYYAEYGRIHRVNATTLILTYHCGPDMANYWDNIAVRRSTDNGVSWSDAQIVTPDNNPNYYGFANPEILVMNNGWLMLSYNGKGNPDVNANSNIQVKISKDLGVTWGEPIIASRGRSWEPAMVQLASGEIQLFYSSEARWWPSNDVQQEILLIKSLDNGATWTNPISVAYAPGNRDGMAVPLILKDDKGIVFPIESVRDSQSPYILWSSMSASWGYGGVGTVQNQRRSLARQGNFGGAPYLIQLNTKETVLSCQETGGRQIGSDFKKNTMKVYIGNSVAKNFTNVTTPWPNLPTAEGAYYSSLFQKDDNTVWLVTTRNFADNHSEIYFKEGKIIR